MQDPISTLKLYPRKSNNLVTTSANTQLHIAKELVDYTQGFEISIDVYFNSATWDYSKHNWLCGRGNNTGFPSGMIAPGLNGNRFACNWKDGGGISAVSMGSKPAGWYRVTMIVTPTTHQQKVQNLSTGEIFLGTAELNGTSTIGESVAFTLFSYGIDGYTGAYGSVGMNVSNVKITRNGATIFHLPLSEGNLAVIRDVVSKTAYTLGFFTISAGWAKLADFSHYNFKNGFTLYKKDSNPNIYVPNDSTGAEIHWTPILSYVRIANYKGTTTTFNQCENVFKLDDVAEVSGDVLAVCPDSFYSSLYVRQNDELYISAANNCEISLAGGTWRFRNRTTYAIPYIITMTWPLINPALENWSVVGVTCSNPVIVSNLDLYTADPDHVLFTEGTGAAKEFDLKTLDFNYDRGFLYINSDVQEKDFMLYRTDKTYSNDLRVIKYIEQDDRITYDEAGTPNHDESGHVELTE